MPPFLTWYKRRINRIFPTVIAWAMMAGWIGYKNLSSGSMLLAGGEFVNAIMAYYILLFFVGKFLFHKLIWVYVACLAIVGFVYWFLFPYKEATGEDGLYGNSTLFRWLPYFIFMLMGAQIGTMRNRFKSRPLLDLVMLGLCGILFYAPQLLTKYHPDLGVYQIFTLLPLAGVVFFFYKIFNADLFRRLYEIKWLKAVVMTVGGLCLESYLIQGAFFTTKLNAIFPLNLLIVSMAILIGCYLLRCFGRFFAQTFMSEDYNFKAIFKFY